MKNLSFVLSLSFLLAFISGCNQSACTDVNCLNGGECNHGECVCPEGFSGEYCENVGEEDPCENVSCLNGGVCVDGSCVCPEGFSGTNCETSVGSPMLGTYSVSQSCSDNTNASFSITITQGSINDQVIISNFGNDGIELIGVVNGTSLQVPSQTVGSSTYNGYGNLQGSVLEIGYNLSFSGGGGLSCSMTCIRQ